MRAAQIERVAIAICQETCAFYGEPPCWKIVAPEAWEKDDCGEPGCRALARAAVLAMEAT